MPTVSKHKKGFSSSSLYRRKEPHALAYLSEKMTFWVAVVSVLAFVTGNMLGQHGWHVFWASVLGNTDETQIVNDGFVSPLPQVADTKCWGKYGGNIHTDPFRLVPQDCLKKLDTYDAQNPASIYIVGWGGTYATGRGEGDHPGDDINVPTGTPVVSIAAGIVEKVSNDAGGYGNYVMIKHPNVSDPGDATKLTTLYSIYGHLSAATAVQGAIVKKGEEIGLSGMTGNASGPHLHFQIDNAKAPWHPYWPFSASEALMSGMSFNQAVDAGLHRERLLEYTVNPVLYVQAHQAGAPAAVRAAQSVAAASSSSKPATFADRLKERLAKRQAAAAAAPQATSARVAAVSAPLVVRTEIVATNTSDVTPSQPPPSIVPVSVDIRYDGDFTAVNQVKQVTIRLLDKDGNTVLRPQMEKPLVPRTSFGKADVLPAALTAKSFNDNGEATITVRELSPATVVLIFQPYGFVSQPIRFMR